MYALRHLDLATVPKVFLTATLVPAHEAVLAEWVGISLRRTLVLRSPSARANHLLQFVNVGPRPDAALSHGVRLAALLLPEWQGEPSVRGIIFVKSLSRLEKVRSSSTFPVCTYHGRMPDDQKQAQLSTWLSDKSPERWIIATTALLHGVDYPRVDAVIFLDSPYGMYDFVQGAGRAGRSGQTALVVVFHPDPLSVPSNDNQYSCEDAMQAALKSSACRRTGVSQLMDGSSITCATLPGSALCDVCHGQFHPLVSQALANPIPKPVPTPALNTLPRSSPPLGPPSALLAGKTAQVSFNSRQEHAQAAKDLITRFSGCFPCRLIRPAYGPCHDTCERSGVSSCSAAPHLPFSCTPELPHRTGWIEWKKCIAFPLDVWRCYFCGLPDSVLSVGEHKVGLPPRVKCRYSDGPITAAWHVLNTPDLMQALQAELGFTPGPDIPQSFATWLGQYNSPSEDIRLFSVFLWLCKRYKLEAFV